MRERGWVCKEGGKLPVRLEPGLRPAIWPVLARSCTSWRPLRHKNQGRCQYHIESKCLRLLDLLLVSNQWLLVNARKLSGKVKQCTQWPPGIDLGGDDMM
jgi:hypothetical protein